MRHALTAFATSLTAALGLANMALASDARILFEFEDARELAELSFACAIEFDDTVLTTEQAEALAEVSSGAWYEAIQAGIDYDAVQELGKAALQRANFKMQNVWLTEAQKKAGCSFVRKHPARTATRWVS